MEKNSLFRLAGWSAYLSAAATIIGAVTLILFFSVGAPFGVINDTVSVVGSLVIIPILYALYSLHRANVPGTSLAALVIGTVAMLVAAGLQTLLVLKIITFEQTAVTVPSAYGVVGLSLVAFNYLAYVNGSFPRKLAVWGIAAGIGYVLVITGFILGGPNHLLTYIGGALAVIAYPIWAFWLGRVWLKFNQV